MSQPLVSRPWFPFVAFLSAIVVVDIGKDIVWMRYTGVPIGPRSFLEQSIWWGMWLVLLPALMGAVRRVTPDRVGWPCSVGVLFLLGLLFVPLHIASSALGMVVLQPAQGLAMWSTRFVGLSNNFFVSGYSVYAACVVTYLVWDHHGRLRERDRQTAEARLRSAHLETLMRDARMDALRRELEPHFLHNALQSISGLVRAGETRKAVDMIAALGGHLRSMLGDQTAPMVALADEVELLRRYVGIEAVRFEDRLRVEFDIDPATEATLVPPLLLQPLVENAIRHGVARTMRPVSIRVASRRDADRVLLSVHDDGPGWDPHAELGSGGVTTRRGVGLENTRERLRLAFGAEATLTLMSPDPGGAEARIEVRAG